MIDALFCLVKPPSPPVHTGTGHAVVTVGVHLLGTSIADESSYVCTKTYKSGVRPGRNRRLQHSSAAEVGACGCAAASADVQARIAGSVTDSARVLAG